jgi:hypothetical protein
MARDVVQRAVRRAEQRLLTSQVVESLQAQRELGLNSAMSRELIELAAREVCATREPDGSWQMSACRTAEHLLLLSELDADATLHERVRPSVEWLRSRVARPAVTAVTAVDGPAPANGTAGPHDGIAVAMCTPFLHNAMLCAHRAPELVGIVPARVNLAGLRLSNGAGFRSDVDGRVALCGLVVAALLTWNVPATTLRPQLAALERSAALEDEQKQQLFSTNGLACVALALLAVAVAERRPGEDAAPPNRAVEGAFASLARLQRADGSWPRADLFFVLSVLVRAAQLPLLEPVLRDPLRRSAEQLALLQQADGGWARHSGAWSLLIGWRVLRAALAGRPESLLAR